jgi:hypothetical protein
LRWERTRGHFPYYPELITNEEARKGKVRARRAWWLSLVSDWTSALPWAPLGPNVVLLFIILFLQFSKAHVYRIFYSTNSGTIHVHDRSPFEILISIILFILLEKIAKILKCL